MIIRKAIVTGGAGFIGSHIVEELVRRGIETISIDDYVAGKEENLAHLKSFPNFYEVECDITDYNDLEQYFEDVDVIFHQAASKKTICLNDPRRDLEINAGGVFNLLELSMKYNVKKFVHASTGSVYGEAVILPQNEGHPLNPTSYYGVSKLAGEKYVNAFHHLYDLNTTILRYFHVYGPRQESTEVGGVVSIFIRRMLEGKDITIFGDGTQERSFTYVKDVVQANILSAKKKVAIGQVYNCASGITITIKQLADMIAGILGIENQEINYDDWMVGDIKTFNIDNFNIINDLGITFLRDFNEGLRLTIDWARDFFKNEDS